MVYALYCIHCTGVTIASMPRISPITDYSQRGITDPPTNHGPLSLDPCKLISPLPQADASTPCKLIGLFPASDLLDGHGPHKLCGETTFQWPGVDTMIESYHHYIEGRPTATPSWPFLAISNIMNFICEDL